MRSDQVKSKRATERFLSTKTATLTDRSRRLGALTPNLVGLRPADMRFSPSNRHFQAANKRLGSIDREIRKRLSTLKAAQTAPDRTRLLRMALVEREVDRARRAFGLFFEVFAQRGTAFAPALAAHDVIARDCYRAARKGGRGLLKKPLIAPLTYLEHGYSPATMRRGVTLKRLLGEPNPFPLIRIPWDRDRPWQATFLHEVAHNLQADLGIWEENKQAVLRRLGTTNLSERLRQIWGKWHKEIFADLAAMLLGGPAAAWGIAEFLAHPETKVAAFKSGAVHPAGFLRVLILAEMARRMGFAKDAQNLSDVWTGLYKSAASRRLPADLMRSAPATIPIVVDEIAYQPRRMLGERALADVIAFRPADQTAIEAGAKTFSRGRVPALPPRFLVSAARLAITQGAAPGPIGDRLTHRLAALYRPKVTSAQSQSSPVLTLAA